MIDPVRHGCPGLNGRTKLCRCGAMINTWTALNRTAQPRTYNAGTDTIHECPVREIPDTVECSCGATVYRYQDGRKIGDNGEPHTCRREAQPQPPKPVVKQPAKPVIPDQFKNRRVIDMG